MNFAAYFDRRGVSSIGGSVPSAAVFTVTDLPEIGQVVNTGLLASGRSPFSSTRTARSSSASCCPTAIPLRCAFSVVCWRTRSRTRALRGGSDRASAPPAGSARLASARSGPAPRRARRKSRLRIYPLLEQRHDFRRQCLPHHHWDGFFQRSFRISGNQRGQRHPALGGEALTFLQERLALCLRGGDIPRRPTIERPKRRRVFEPWRCFCHGRQGVCHRRCRGIFCGQIDRPTLHRDWRKYRRRWKRFAL